MPSTFFGLSIAASGIYTYQAQLNVTGHNVSNARTDGYSKQVAVQTTKDPISLGTSYGMIGAGSEINSIVNTRDSYYDYKYRKSNSTYGYYDILSYYMESIQDHLYSADASSAGIANSIGNFFNTLVSMNGDAANTTKRTEAMGFADTFAEYANEIVRNLKEMQYEVNTEISTAVNKINAYAEEIASLNKQINSLEVYGGKANDLRDQREKLIDELSTLVNVDVVEQAPADGVNGLTQYIVTVGGGGVLVDTYSVNKLNIVPMETYANQCDSTGLYDIKWQNGQSFGIRNTQLGGTLQGLLEMRDGNNAENFKADLDLGSIKAGSNKIAMSADASSYETASNLAKLNIPSTKGVITIGGIELEYESFEVSIDSNGTYTYEFTLKEDLTTSEVTRINKFAADAGGSLNAQIGDSVEFRGIPYYIAQLNEFVRTLSATINQQQNRGYDLYDNKGVDMFMATDITTNDQLDMTEFLKNTSDGYYYLNGNKVFASSATNNDYTDYLTKKGYDIAADYTITDNGAQTIAGLSYNLMTVTDKDGKFVENIYRANQAEIFQFSSITQSGVSTSYYSLTAETFAANREMVKDGKLIAAALKDIDGTNTGTAESGVEENANLELLAALMYDTTMFKQGDPVSFLQVMTATAGVDGDKVASSADNAKDITDAVDLRRLSVSGVDEDEEGQMMIILQNLLNLQYRVVSIMNQVLSKLINEMGV